MNTKSFFLFALVASASLFCGCAAFVATPTIGLLYTDVTAPVTYDAGRTGQAYQVLSAVEGKSSATNILGLVATGDASVRTAYLNALKQVPGADALVDVTIDYKGNSVLGIVATYTTIVRGKAVKRNP